jgi:hypothetical protein
MLISFVTLSNYCFPTPMPFLMSGTTDTVLVTSLSLPEEDYTVIMRGGVEDCGVLGMTSCTEIYPFVASVKSGGTIYNWAYSFNIPKSYVLALKTS